MATLTRDLEEVLIFQQGPCEKKANAEKEEVETIEPMSLVEELRDYWKLFEKVTEAAKDSVNKGAAATSAASKRTRGC